MILKDGNSKTYSVIVNGGQVGTNLATKTVEILDEGAPACRSGPELPTELDGSSLIEDRSVGVMLVVGSYLNTLYHLPHTNDEQTLMDQTLAFGRASHVTFLVPVQNWQVNKTHLNG